MKPNRYLEGENIAPRTSVEARALIGKRVEYLTERDIDKSGRGYYWPRFGSIESVKGRNIQIDGDWLTFRDIREMRALEAA
ncbi:MAG: hypothetical protein WA191_06990 [Telluria sp.]